MGIQARPYGFKYKLAQIFIWCPLYALVYKRWLHNGHSKDQDSVLEVLGWRRARICSTSGGVQTITPCFKILWWEFD
jgi:hypothetical protein